jgi:uncharacterized protein
MSLTKDLVKESMQLTEEPDFTKISEYVRSQFRCGSDSVHGLQHWRNVDDNARLLCPGTGADLTVVRLFAFLHDHCRLDDGGDRNHGKRAADRLGKIPSSLLKITPDQMKLLDYAIRHHVDGKVSDDSTIGACWDADRLDLGRVGIDPDAKYMSTYQGKELVKEGLMRRT